MPHTIELPLYAVIPSLPNRFPRWPGMLMVLALALLPSIACPAVEQEGSILKALLARPLKERLVEQQEQLVAENTAAIDEHRQAGAAVADILCERALAYARLGKKQEALNDMQAALAERPNPAPSLIRCKADVDYINGDMKSSEANYARAIAQGQTDGNTYFQRAMANHLLGKFREAGDGFALAFDRYTEQADKVRAEAMRLIALRRQNPRARVTAQIAAEDSWPGVILAAAGGSKNDEEVLRQVHHRADDELESALADAYFYLAEINLAEGNRIKALVYFERSADKGVLPSPLRPAARTEYERMHR